VLRWVDDELQIGLYEVSTIESSSLVTAIKDCLLRLNISLTKVRGQCYDGASNMSGIRQGVATVIQAEQPNAFYTHCYGHSLNLAIADTIKSSATMKRALDICHEVTKLVKYSPRRQNAFNKLKEELSPGNPGVRTLCPTRWTIRADSMESIIQNYSVLQELWDEAVNFVRDSEVIARIRGVASQMQLFDFFFGLVLGESLLRNTDNLSRTLQKKNYSAAEGQLTAKRTKEVLQSIRSEESFNLFWEKVNSLAAKDDVNDPVLPRKRKVPRRFDDGNAEPEHDDSPKDMYRRIYYESLDLLVQAIEDRFNQPGYRMYSNLETLLMKAVKKEDYSNELEVVLRVYKDDFNASNLTTHLNILGTTIPRENYSISDILTYLQKLSSAEKELIKEVIVLAKLILVMPATNSTSERSFSALRRLKTYLRSTMRQERLNSLMIIHVHKDLTDKINIREICNDFISKGERRHQVFGTF